jgi:flagellar motility protein MotE (MotC chaperone)
MTTKAGGSMTTMGRAMISRIGAPRLLPVTICLLALALTWRSILLVGSAIDSVESAFLIPTAWASGPDGEKTPGEKASGEKAGGEKAGGAKQTEHAAKPEPGMQPPAIAEKPSVQDAPRSVTDGERSVLLELRQRRQELDAREATLAARESMLAAAEMKLSARIGELQSLQQRLEALDAGHRQQEDAAWQGLVKVYETMKPRDAAAIFNDLGMPVLLSVVGRMKEAKAAAVLAAMLPDKARDVTTQLALSRTQAIDSEQTGGKPALTPGPGKAPGSGT